MTNGSSATAATGELILIDREYERERLELYLTKGIHCQIVGPGGIGKTALLSNVGQIARDMGGKFRVAYADLSDASCQTVAGLLERISTAWGVQPPYTNLIQLSEQVRALRKQGIRPVLCLDNFEEMVRRDREFATDFFVDLRGIAQAGLMIVTSSRKSLSELIPWYSRTSPFFNMFDILSIGPLPDDAAANMLDTCFSGKGTLAPQEKQTLLRFARGYPLAIQLACAEAARAKEVGESLEMAVRRAEEQLQSRLPSWETVRS